MKSYIKFLSRNKLYTAIEAVGLAVSLAFVILIGTYVWQQYMVAHDCPDSDRVYMIGTTDWLGLGSNDKEEIDMKIPDVEISARFEYIPWKEVVTFNGEEKSISALAETDPEFFTVFPDSYEIIEGSLDDFNSEGSVLISEEFAKSLGEEDLIGQILERDKEYRIAGIYSTDNISMFPYADILQYYGAGMPDDVRFMITETFTFLKAAEGVERDDLEAKVIQLCEANYDEDELDGAQVRLYSLDEMYFSDLDNFNTAHANKSFLIVLIFVVLALLASSVFNYVNLSFAMTGKRAKEMATRRLVGAGVKDVFGKCVLESVVFTVVCFAVALMMAVALEPMMNRLLVDEMAALLVQLRIELTAGYLLVTLSLVVLTGAVAGAVPAWHAAHYEAVEVASGLYRRKSKMVFSKVFIIVQNTLSVILISMAILMESQLSFMMNRPLNSDSENIFYLESEVIYDSASRSMLADELRNLPEVLDIGFSTGYQGNMEGSFNLPSKLGHPIRMSSNSCDSAYFKMLNPVILSDFGTPMLRSLWFSESAAADMGLNEANPDEFEGYFNSLFKYDCHIGGIYKDIPNSNALDFMNDYSCLILQNESAGFTPYSIVLKTVSEEPEVREAILSAYEKFIGEHDLFDVLVEARFISDAIYSSLEPARRQIRLVEIFMFIAVILSLLDLLAMSTYFSGQKSKEIAIRKVFGGTVETETLASVRSYMIMVLIACVIGVPVAVYAAGRYLEQFAYRIGNYWWAFALAVLLSFAISLLSVLWQTLKTARTNPASELKKE